MKSKKSYSSKQIWKVILSIVALLIIGISLWYTNYLASEIQDEERLRVKLWSETVRKQAQLVNLTNETFKQLSQEESDNINDYAMAVKEFGREQNDYTFAISFLEKNLNIPIVLEVVDYKSGEEKISISSSGLTFYEKDFNTEKDLNV